MLSFLLLSFFLLSAPIDYQNFFANTQIRYVRILLLPSLVYLLEVLQYTLQTGLILREGEGGLEFRCVPAQQR